MRKTVCEREESSLSCVAAIFLDSSPCSMSCITSFALWTSFSLRRLMYMPWMLSRTSRFLLAGLIKSLTHSLYIWKCRLDWNERYLPPCMIQSPCRPGLCRWKCSRISLSHWEESHLLWRSLMDSHEVHWVARHSRAWWMSYQKKFGHRRRLFGWCHWGGSWPDPWLDRWRWFQWRPLAQTPYQRWKPHWIVSWLKCSHLKFSIAYFCPTWLLVVIVA